MKPGDRITLGFAICVLAAISPLNIARAADPTSLWFFGDSLTDEGRAGRSAPVMWPGVLRSDLGVTSGFNYAIAGSYTSNQPSPIFGDESFLGQVNSFVTSSPTLGADPVAGVWTGTNNIWIGSYQGLAPAAIVAHASGDVRTGLAQLSAAGVHSIDLLGVYDLSLTNAFELANANTPAVRAAAAVAAQQYNATLASMQTAGATTTFFNIATFITYLQRNAKQYGFTNILPLAPGQTCDATCQQTSIFVDTIHLTSKTQTLIGNYIASGNPIYNSYPMVYGALASDVWSASGALTADMQTVQGTWAAFTQGLIDQLDASHGAKAADPRHPFEAFAYGQIAGGQTTDSSIFSGGRFDWVTPNFTGGVSYLVRPDLRIGAAFGFSQSIGSLGGSLSSRNFEGTLFATFARRNFYVDAVVGLGASELAQTRTGSFGGLASHPDAHTFGSTVRAAYLFDVGAAQIGPVVQGAYSYTTIDSFAESGDPLYAVAVGQQSAADLTADFGLEARASHIGSLPIAPFADVMLERHLLGAPSLTSYFAALPTQLLPSAAIAYPDGGVRGDAGVEFPLGGSWSGRITASAEADSNGIVSYGGNAGFAGAF